MSRILLAEDDDSLRGFLARALERAGHEVTSCADGEEAVAYLDEPWDLLLTDIVMPGLDGIEVARQAAADSGEAVIVAGSLPPALGSYRPDLFDHSRSVAIHRVLIDGLSAHVDLWLAETQSSIAEVRAVAEALGSDSKPLWLSFTLLDVPGADGVARLRSGEAVAEAVQVAAQLGARAVLFNCSQPEVMAQALRACW